MTPYWTNGIATLLLGDTLGVLRGLPDGVAHMVVTSPPYWRVRN